jgi:hypothetical protein
VFLLISLTGSLRGLLREPALRRRRQLARELRGAAAQGAGAGSRRCMPPHNHTPHNHNTTRARPSREWACLSVSYGGAWPQSDRRGAACGACTYLLLRHLLGQLGGNPPSPANRAGAGRGRLRCGAVS